MAVRTSPYRRPDPARIDQRGVDRHPVFIQQATMRRHRAPSIEAKLYDVSIFGCRLACDAPVKPDERIWLRIRGGMPIAATVMWASDGLVGCRFDAPISSGTVRALSLGL
jgi:hypothetical protein